QEGLFEEGRELFQKMLEDGVNIESSSDLESRVLPDTYTFNTMLEACAEQKKWDDFGYAYREMLRHGYHFNAKRHLKMVLEASRAGKVNGLKHFELESYVIILSENSLMCVFMIRRK